MNNKIGIYFAYWVQEWGADYTIYIKKVKQLGFDILELSTANLVDMKQDIRREIRRTAEENGITLTFCLGTPPQYDMSSPEESVRRSGIEYAKRTLEAINDMGGKTYGGINYACWPVQKQPTSLDEKAQYRERSLESLRYVIPEAEGYGINYCFEIVNRFEQFLLNTAEEGAAFCKDIGSDYAKLMLDTFHMNIEEDDFAQALETAGSYLGHFHIGEPNRKTPGTGRMPWRDIIKALKKIDYCGALVMEPFLMPGGQVGEDIRVWRDLSDGADESELDDKAALAYRYIRASLDSVY